MNKDLGFDLNDVSPELLKDFEHRYSIMGWNKLAGISQRPLYKKGDRAWILFGDSAEEYEVVSCGARIAEYRMKRVSDNKPLGYMAVDWGMYPTKAIAEWHAAHQRYWGSAHILAERFMLLPGYKERLGRLTAALTEEEKKLIRSRYVDGEELV